MEEMREIAKAFYEIAGEDEKDLVRKKFKKFDVNGDGQITISSFNKLGPWKSNEKVFKLLDANGDGTLDFEDVLLEYYFDKKAQSIAHCKGCNLDILKSTYFSCLLCLGKLPHDTYNLCCDCYRGGKFKHMHELKFLLDTYSLARVLKVQRTADAKKSKGKMEGMREIAKAFYEIASEDEKDLVKKKFKELDVNGDGKINMSEFKKLGPWFGNEIVFNQLNENGDGTLDFDDGLLVYYLENKAKSKVRCNECRLLVGSLYFSCLLCLGKSPKTFDLCSTCHRGGILKHEHEHEFKYLLDSYSLVQVLKDQRKADAEKSKVCVVDVSKEHTDDAERSKGKKEKEELGKIAKSHYQAGRPEVQKLAREFFKSMDTNGDDKVNLQEFLTFMRRQGHAQFSNPYFFKELDKDNNGNLDFDEVLTLYYIVKSGRPFCDSCGNFIPGTYFSCAKCFSSRESSVHMCHDCYAKQKHSDHLHDGRRSQFLDNYTLLQATRDANQRVTTHVPVQRSNTDAVSPPLTTPNYSTTIVPALDDTAQTISGKAFKVFEAELYTGGSNECSIM